MAIFSWKKSDDSKATNVTTSGGAGGQPPSPSGGGGGGGGDDAEFSPEKATKFFDRAHTVHDTTNYEYATQLWLSGLRFHPGSMRGLEGLFKSIAAFLGDNDSKKGMSKDVSKTVGGKSDVDRFLLSALEWGLRPTEGSMAVRALEGAAKLNLTETTLWIGIRAAGAVANDKKPSKSMMMKISECFEKIGAYEKSLATAEQALKMDPSDGELAAHIRELAAQATMSRGGFDQAGQQGGFRGNIRDASKQQQLEDEGKLAKTEETIERLIANARTEFASRPGDIPSLEKLARFLMDRRRPSDEEEAYKLYMQAFETGKAFRFRELAGDIRIRQAARKVSDLKGMQEAAKSPDEKAMLERMVADHQTSQWELELSEYKLRVENYPTDLARKFELGKRCFWLGKHNDAIDLFQEVQSDPKNRGLALNYLGQSFLAISWNDEATETFRRALEMRDQLPETMLELRYWLMVALQNKAAEHRDLATAEEADKIASSIAVQSISYRDIRARREQLKKLVGELRSKAQ